MLKWLVFIGVALLAWWFFTSGPFSLYRGLSGAKRKIEKEFFKNYVETGKVGSEHRDSLIKMGHIDHDPSTGKPSRDIPFNRGYDYIIEFPTRFKSGYEKPGPNARAFHRVSTESMVAYDVCKWNPAKESFEKTTGGRSDSTEETPQIFHRGKYVESSLPLSVPSIPENERLDFTFDEIDSDDIKSCATAVIQRI